MDLEIGAEIVCVETKDFPAQVLVAGGCDMPASDRKAVYSLDPRKREWESIFLCEELGGLGGRLLSRLNMVAVPHDNCVFFFGGWSRDETHSNEMCVVRRFCNEAHPDDDTIHWSLDRIAAKGTPPSPRDKLGACVYDNKMIVFGGWGPVPTHHTHSRDFIASDPLAGDMQTRVLGWNSEVVCACMGLIWHIYIYIYIYICIYI